jgi:hypothetical protein
MRIRIALPLLCAACTYARAQSSVTLNGIVDFGIAYANSVQTAKTGAHPSGASQIALTDAIATGLATPSANIDKAAMTVGSATMTKIVGSDRPAPSMAPPANDPTTEPLRPIAFAQLTPVARQSVG